MTGVVDWSGAQVADPECDIAASLLLLSVAAPELASNVPPEAFEAFAFRLPRQLLAAADGGP